LHCGEQSGSKAIPTMGLNFNHYMMQEVIKLMSYDIEVLKAAKEEREVCFPPYSILEFSPYSQCFHFTSLYCGGTIGL
jgi:hypothetical protein